MDTRKDLIQYATTQSQGAENFRSLRRKETERIADFIARAKDEFGPDALILFKSEGGNCAFKTQGEQLIIS